jgi:tetratricopeptide (TPR) repeat protein
VVRLVTAPGGYGKSRLAARFASGLSGWVVWRVAVGAEAGTAEGIDAGEVPGLLLLVVDYAESRDPAGLAALLCAAARAWQAGARVRVLLLARAAGPWWSTLSAWYPQQATLVDSLTVAGNTVQLQAQADQRDPGQVVASAVEQFARRLGCAPPVGYRPRAHPAGTPLLRLHAEALVAVLGGARGSGGRGDVLAEVLGHETRYWRGCARRLGLSLPADAGRADGLLGELVGVAALLGADDDGEVEGIVRRVPGLAGADPVAVSHYAAWLRQLYPAGAAAAGSGCLGTLQPDLLAEHLAVQVLMGCTAAQRSVILTGLGAGQAVRALTVLGRAVSDQPAVAGLLDEVLAADLVVMAGAVLGVARQFPGVFAARLAAVLATAEVDPGLLRSLVDEVPYPSLELHPVALALTSRLVRHGGGSPGERARWLTWHALRLAEAGRRAEALAASQEAVDLYRELAAGNRDAYLPNLAMSVNNHALRLAEAGRRAEALTASQEAVDLRRELAAGNRDAYLPDLATSLWMVGWVYLDVDGPMDYAVESAVEAVRLFEQLHAGEPGVFTDRLHAAARTLAEVYERAGNPDAAARLRARYGL